MGQLPTAPWISAPSAQTVFLCVLFNYFLHESFKAKRFVQVGKKHGLEPMRTVICKKEKCQLSIPQLLQADFKLLMARTLCLTTKLIVGDAWILKDLKCKISGAACSLFEPCSTAGHLVQYLSSGPSAPYTKFSM